MALFVVSYILLAVFYGTVLGRHCNIHLEPNTDVYYANVGETVSVTCGLSCFGVLRPQEVKWQTPEKSTILNTTGRISTALYHKGRKIKLFLTNVTSIDTGSYTCRGKINGDHQTVSFTLIIADPNLGAAYPLAEDVGSTNSVGVDEFTPHVRHHRSPHYVLSKIRRHRARRDVSTTVYTTTTTPLLTSTERRSTTPGNQQSTVDTTTTTSPHTSTERRSTTPGMQTWSVDTTTTTSPHTSTERRSTTPDMQTWSVDTTTTTSPHTSTESRSKTPSMQKSTVDTTTTTSPHTSTERRSTTTPVYESTDRHTDTSTKPIQTATATQGHTQKTIRKKPFKPIPTDLTSSTTKEPSSRDSTDRVTGADVSESSAWGTQGLAAFAVTLSIAIVLLIALIVVIVLPKLTQRARNFVLRPPKENRTSRANTNSADYFSYKQENPNPILTVETELADRPASKIQTSADNDALKKNGSFTVIDLDDDSDGDVIVVSKYKADDSEETDRDSDTANKSGPSTPKGSNTSLSSMLENAGLTKEESKITDDEDSLLGKDNETEKVDTEKNETKDENPNSVSTGDSSDEDSALAALEEIVKETDVTPVPESSPGDDA